MRAAWIKISICAVTLGCPTYSARVLGRTARSMTSSSTLPAEPMMRSCSMPMISSLRLGRRFERATDDFGGGQARLIGRLEETRDLGGLVAERYQRGKGLALRARGRRTQRRTL